MTYTCGWALPTGLSLRGILSAGTPEFGTLQVGNSPISSPENVATYLRLLMPELLTVSTCDTMDSTHKMHWMAVSASLA
ncbi:hypothetical protein EV401DRAFT_1954391 [Pisolithus croceorrhizus]|nr:hypothetical protein EV401DRAFT_1954391 [Pisolithus croceorrhizus]